MNIAHVLSSFGVGGQERVALDLARRQHAAGHDVAAFAVGVAPEGPLRADFEAAGVPARAIARRWPAGLGVDPTMLLRLAAALRRRRAEVVHTHNPHALIYGAPAGKLARAAVVHTKHGANPERSRLRRAAALLADAFVAVSDATAAAARAARDYPPERVRVIANGIDLARFAPDAVARRGARAELDIPEDAWVVGTVGRLAPEKNQALLVAAAAPLLGPGARLVIVGEGPERAALAAEWVHLAGARGDVPRLLAAFDVFALPSRTEGLPLVIPEAMASALPVVATAVGGVPAVLDEGETGFLVPAGDETALRARLARLRDDPALARRIGARAREVALARYSLDRMADAYTALYHSVRRRRG